MKTQILAAIGEKELQPAACLNAALAANDRVKYAFSLLQLASDHAEHPEQAVATLKRERISCGIDDPDFDTAVADRNSLAFLIQQMGPDHVLFGSDFPYEIGDADGSIALPVVSALDADQRDAILFGNAKRLLG